MNPTPHPWRQPTAPSDTALAAPAEPAITTTELPLDTDLTALLARDDTLLATVQEQCRVRNLFLVHDGREIKVSPVVQPGWRVIVEIDKDMLHKAAA